MSKIIKATKAHVEAIKSMAFGAEATEMRMHGVSLTHDQADEIGDEGCDWLRSRLGLNANTDDAGVIFRV